MPVHLKKTSAGKGELHPRSIDAFCARNGISRGSFYNMVKRNEAPKVLRIGARVIVTEEAEAEWRTRRTAPA